MSAGTTLPDGCPAWLRELDLLRTACSHFLVTGNSDDSQLVPAELIDSGDGVAFADMEDVLTEALGQMGHDLVIHYDIVSGVRYSRDPEDNDRLATIAKGLFAKQPEAVAKRGDLDGLAQLIAAVGQVARPVALAIHDASRLVVDLGELTEPEFAFFRTVNHLARTSATDEDRSTFNPVVWLVHSERDLPNWFVVQNHQVRHVTVPMPDPETRRLAAQLWLDRLPAGEAQGEHLTDPVATFAAQTAGFTLNQANAVVRLAEEQGLTQTQVEDAVRSYRVGVLDNPWRRTYLAERLLPELAAVGSVGSTINGQAVETVQGGAGDRPTLCSRVIGQDRAVRRALDILVRSVTGLTAAHASPSATRPRGVLFFAGPTGVGKTELAKGITQLLFDDPEAYIRFDMSEFSSEHAADRLIGAPPGYVGHDAGGELTNALRARPFSVVLFDEIEKADARILDKFLQILDDGRLTDGQGQTVFFTEAVIVFTSNLGVYVEDESGLNLPRKLNVNRGMKSNVMQETLTRAIQKHFTRDLGRPELLNRLGDNIVIFDFIDEVAGAQILELMTANVLRRVEAEQGLSLSIAPSVLDWLKEQCLDEPTLDLGGRGVGSALESHLVNPLARAVFLHRPELGGAAIVARVDDGEAVTLHLEAAPA